MLCSPVCRKNRDLSSSASGLGQTTMKFRLRPNFSTSNFLKSSCSTGDDSKKSLMFKLLTIKASGTFPSRLASQFSSSLNPPLPFWIHTSLTPFPFWINVSQKSRLWVFPRKWFPWQSISRGLTSAATDAPPSCRSCPTCLEWPSGARSLTTPMSMGKV